MIWLLCSLTFICVFSFAILVVRATRRPQESGEAGTGVQLDERKKAFRRVMDDPALRAPDLFQD